MVGTYKETVTGSQRAKAEVERGAASHCAHRSRFLRHGSAASAAQMPFAEAIQEHLRIMQENKAT